MLSCAGGPGTPWTPLVTSLLHDLANDGGCVALKWAAEDRQGWIQKKDAINLLYMQQKTTDDYDIIPICLIAANYVCIY